MLKAVFFDVDGTLLDTERFQFLGWVEVLKPYDVRITKEEYTQYAGKPSEEIEKILRSKYGLEAGISIKKKQVMLDLFDSHRIDTLPYVKESLEFLRSKKLGAISGSTQKEAELKIKKANLTDYFDVVLGVHGSIRGKPAPDLYLKALKTLNIEASKALVFEDTSSGVTAAKDAGIFTVAIPTEFSLRQDFSKADGVCKNMREAVDFVKDLL
ncbi:MAG: HAD family phosphatase [Candidatus Micrarchaeota archaeon]